MSIEDRLSAIEKKVEKLLTFYNFSVESDKRIAEGLMKNDKKKYGKQIVIYTIRSDGRFLGVCYNCNRSIMGNIENVSCSHCGERHYFVKDKDTQTYYKLK